MIMGAGPVGKHMAIDLCKGPGYECCAGGTQNSINAPLLPLRRTLQPPPYPMGRAFQNGP